jgi:hypothetical protein
MNGRRRESKYFHFPLLPFMGEMPDRAEGADRTVVIKHPILSLTIPRPSLTNKIHYNLS